MNRSRPMYSSQLLVYRSSYENDELTEATPIAADASLRFFSDQIPHEKGKRTVHPARSSSTKSARQSKE